MAPERAVGADHVRDVILKDLDRRSGRSGPWEVEFVSRARESWLFKARSPNAPWPLAVKVYCTAVPKTLPMRQIKALQHYHSAITESGLTVPAPFAAVPQHRAGPYGPMDPAMDERLLTVFRLAEALYSGPSLGI